jgi:lipoprotein-releasing system permease protein
MSYELFIAGRYLKAKRKQTFISIITFLSVTGVAVGVMALVVVIAVMTGAESDFRSRILGIESHVMVMRHGGSFSNYEMIQEVVKKTDGVKAVSPFVYTQVMLRSSSGFSGALLRGVDPEASVQLVQNYSNEELLKRLPPRDAVTPDESQTSANVVPGIILGWELARTLEVGEGDIIYIVSPKGMISPIGHIPSMNRFRVTGDFKSGLYEYDGSFSYVHIQDAQKILGMGDSVTGIGVWLHDIYKADTVKEKISDELGFPYWGKDWMQMNQSLFSALKLEKAAMFIILILIVLVAAFNIASTLIMLVMEKTRDIAILKAMGATDKSIRKIFVLQGIIIGFIGTSIGLILGLILCKLLKRYQFVKLPDIYPFTTLPIQLETFDVVVIGVSAMLICYLATLYPAYQASKLDPVEAIRYG